jgi:hypothetical protein
MFRSRSESVLVALTLALGLGPAVGVAAQEASATSNAQRILTAVFNISDSFATLGLELTDGRESEFSIHDGRAWINGDAVQQVERGSDLERSWRDLLAEAQQADSDDMAELLVDWDPPGDSPLDAALEAMLESAAAARSLGDGTQLDIQIPNIEIDPDINLDSVERMVVRIRELQDRVDELESFPVTVDVVSRAARGGGSWLERGPLRHLFRGLSGIMQWAIFYAVVFAIAFATIFFGGRRYIEAVADTARVATTRSLLVGMAASFLVIPAFILGIIALAISIVGIPVLIAWIPLFPVAVGLAVMLGYIGVAHAAGEALAERRFYATDWFQRGNSYYFIMSGLGLLVAPFIVVNVIRMAGPWLGFIGGIFTAVGVVVTWSALSIGLGAVLLTRGGTRPGPRSPSASKPEPDIYAEPTSA